VDRHVRRHPGGQGGRRLTATLPEGRRGWSAGAALGWGLQTYRGHVAPLTLLALLVLVAGVVVQAAGYPLRASVTPPLDSSGRIQPGALFGLSLAATMGVTAAAVAAGVVAQAGLVRVALSHARGAPVGVGEAYRGLDLGAVVLTALATGAVAFVGLMLCVVPALIGLFLVSYALYFVVDQGMPAGEALRASVRLTARHPGTLGSLWFASLGLGALGVCLCGIGLLVVVPVVALAQAWTFRIWTGDPAAA
jgi:hypothetical protein